MRAAQCLCPSKCSGPKVREGARILNELVDHLHAVTTDRGVSIEAMIPLATFDRLCMWQSQCEDCEFIEAVEADEDQNLTTVSA